MTQPDHPDALTDWQAFKELRRGSYQYAQDHAMDAYWRAMDSGMDKEEAGKVFSDTYKKCLDGK